MPYVVAGGLRFHVQHLGAGSPVVMVHGLFTGSAASWYLGAAPVLARRHHVVCYDQRGHGLSDRPERGYDLATLAGDLDALTGDLEPFALVGHSYGGVVALRFAVDRPGRVTRLVLVDSFTPAEGDPIPGVSDATAHAGAISWTDVVNKAIRSRRPRRKSAAVALADSTSLVADIRVAGQITDDELASIAVPVMCIAGESSPFGDAVAALAHKLPGAHTVTIPGGHALTVEGGEMLDRLLVEYCDV